MNLADLKREIEGDPENTRGLFDYIRLLRRTGQQDHDLAYVLADAAARLGDSCLEVAFTKSRNLSKSKEAKKRNAKFFQFFETLEKTDANFYRRVLFRSRRFFWVLNCKLLQEKKHLFNDIQQGLLETLSGNISDMDFDHTKMEFISSLPGWVRSDHSPTREAVAMALSSLRDPEAIPYLLQLAKDPISYIAGTAMNGLAAIGDPKTLPALIEIVTEGEGDQKYSAVWAIGAIQDKRALEFLITIRNKPQFTWVSLESLGDPRALPIITPFLFSESSTTQSYAYDATKAIEWENL